MAAVPLPPSLAVPVVDEKRMRPVGNIHWLRCMFRFIFGAVILLVAWQEGQAARSNHAISPQSFL